MTAFSVQSQLLILSKLDRVLWSANTPILVYLEDHQVDRFLNNSLVSYLRNHQIKNQGIVFTPTREDGIIFSLAEGISQFCEEPNPAALASLPIEQWQLAWNHRKTGVNWDHRILIIDQLELILEASREDQLKFSQLLGQFAQESGTSVLAFASPDFAESLSTFPEFQTPEASAPVRTSSVETCASLWKTALEARIVQKTAAEAPSDTHCGLPDTGPTPVVAENLPSSLEVLGSASTPSPDPVSSCLGTVREPRWRVISAALASLLVGAILISVFTTARDPLANNPDPVKSPILVSLTESPGKPDLLPLLSRSMEIQASFDMPNNWEMKTGKPAASFDRLLKIKLLSNTPAIFHAPGEILEQQPLLPEVNPPVISKIEKKAIPEMDRLLERPQQTVEPIIAASITPLPLSIPEWLDRFKSAPDQSLGSLRAALPVMAKDWPDRPISTVEEWISTLESDPKRFEIMIAEVFARTGDTEYSYTWYQRSLKRTGSAEARFQVGVAQLLGRGTTKNYHAATDNLLKSWEAGNPEGAYLYAVAHLFGWGVSRNERYAFHTLNEAIHQGSKLAYREAARIHELGIGNPKNLYWAFHLYQEGAKYGDPFCMERAAAVIAGENRLFLPDQKRASQWKQRAGAATEDPILQQVRALAPADFYTRVVKR